jgi:RNA polymerase sigma factor (TIGR02999 family)
MHVDTELPHHYHALKRIAQRLRAKLRPGDTLSTTVVVHEAYARLAEAGTTQVEGEPHLISLCARAMRFVLIDHIRAKASAKRGDGERPMQIDALQLASLEDPAGLLALHQALLQLEQVDPRAVQLIELRMFAGLDPQQVADQLGVTVRTVQRDWQRAYAWLATCLQ